MVAFLTLDLIKMIIKKVLFVFILLLFIHNNATAQHKILFRYNADYDVNSELQTPVIVSNVSVNQRTEDSEEVARGTDGWGYSSRNTAYFYVDSSSIVSTENAYLSAFGYFEVSGELWVKIFSLDGNLVTWDDTSKAHGVRLSLQDGHLILYARLSNETYSLVMPEQVSTSEWLRIGWYCRVGDDSIEQSIQINGFEQAYQKIALRAGVGFTVLNAQVQLGYTAVDSLEKSFKGELYAAILRNYIPVNAYRSAGGPADGSAYMGLVAYHDYPPNGSEESMDMRISDNLTPITRTIFVPYLNDEFIPQGVTNSYEDEDFADSTGMIYISLYHKTVDGTTRLKRSIIVEIDPENGKVRRCFRLTGQMKTGHNGGIAFKNNAIYVATGSQVEVYPLPQFTGSGTEKYQDLATDYSNLYTVQSKASFITYYSDTIWVGDYRTSSDSNKPYLYGYPLDDAGRILTSEVPKIYRLPYNTQGVAWRIIHGKRYLFISKTGMSDGSRIYRCKYSDLSKFAEPVIDTSFTVPSGGEDISFNAKGELINVSESGAKYFQKKSSPWNTFYPFIFTISEEVLSENIDEDENEIPILINEVLVDPDTDEKMGDANNDGMRNSWQDEFVEILNISDLPFDLSGWKLGDDERLNFTFPEDYVLYAHQFVVVFGGGNVSKVPGYDPDPLITKVFATDDSIGNGLANSGDYVLLVSPSGQMDMYLAYGSKADAGPPSGSIVEGIAWEVQESTFAKADNNNSLTRSPDGQNSLNDNFVEHLAVSDKPFSPGTTINGLDSVVTIFGDEKSTLLYKNRIYNSYPNPFNSSTVVTFELNDDFDLEITMYNLLGQRVRTFEPRKYYKGSNLLRWNGTDDEGNVLPSGVYFIAIRSKKFSLLHKMVLVR